MVGRQVIAVNRPLSLQELEQVMQEGWDKERYADFRIGRPTSASIEEYILLPATYRFLVIVYPRAAGWLFSRQNKVILSVADTPASAQLAFFEYMPKQGPLTRLWQTSQVLSAEKERRGPAEEALQAYTAHMRDVLSQHGLLA
jgi:hypothetical protein